MTACNHGCGRRFIKLSANLSHGEHAAGIIPGIDSTGLIMPVVASAAVGDGRDKNEANAIHYSVDNGAQIINISFSKAFSSNKVAPDEAVIPNPVQVCLRLLYQALPHCCFLISLLLPGLRQKNILMASVSKPDQMVNKPQTKSPFRSIAFGKWRHPQCLHRRKNLH